MKNNIHGLGVALVTPFGRDGDIDYSSLRRLVEHVIEGGVDYLVVLGTTAETPTLAPDEKISLLTFVREVNRGRLPIVAGIGGNNTKEVVASVETYDLTGVSAVLSVTPYYNRPSQQGLYEHYRAIAGASPAPVLLYNVPARTGVNLTADTTLRLAHNVDNIIGVKEACGSLNQMGYILRDRPEGFMVISGDDSMALPLIAMGGDGVISVAANAFPRPVKELVDAAQHGDRQTASAVQLRLLEAVDSLFIEGNPTGIKTALAVKGLIENHLRLPLVAGSDVLAKKIMELADRYSL